MDSKQTQNWPRNSIDDIVTQCESLSISSSETDNITLDSGIFFDNKNDNVNSKVYNSGSIFNMLNSSVAQPPPPPPPYNSTHNIISHNNQSNETSPFHSNTSASNIHHYNKSDHHLSSTFEPSITFHNIIGTSSTVTASSKISQHMTYNNNNQFPLFYKDNDSKHDISNNRLFDKSSTSFMPRIIARQKPQSFKNFDYSKLNNDNYSYIQNNPKQTIDRISFPTNNIVDNHTLGNCSKCHSTVTDSESACIALGRLYHSACFLCSYCNRSLRGKVFYKDQENVYCEQDYLTYRFQRSAKVCSACGQGITENVLEALEKDFHPRCFKCCICQKCLDGIPFTVDQNNNIYCISDYHLIFAPRCTICCKPIIPRYDSEDVVRIVVNNKDFHIECYRCQNCSKSLTNDSNCFVWTTNKSVANVKLLCRKCYGDIFRKMSLLQH